jgi:hypothetical protein
LDLVQPCPLCIPGALSHLPASSHPLAKHWSKPNLTKTGHAVAWHDHTMPSLSPLTSGLHLHVLDVPLPLLDQPVPSFDQGNACTRQHRRAQNTPATPCRAWSRRQSAPERAVPRHLSLSLATSACASTHLTTRTPPDNHTSSPSPCSRRHGRRPSAAVHGSPMMMTTRPILPLPRHDARQHCLDVANTQSPFLAPSPPWNGDATVNLARSPQYPWPL